MEKIHILTDSSSDIPHDLVEAHGIEIVPIMLTHEGRSFREYYDITSEDYCRLLETSSEIPGTAMTTPTVFLESYNRAFERGCTHLLAVLINGGGSGTYQAACLAGLGIIQVPRVGYVIYCGRKKLIEILPQYRAEPMPVSLIYPHRRNLSRRTICSWSG